MRKNLIFVGHLPPSRPVAGDRQIVFSSPRNPVQWAAVAPGGDLSICFLRLVEGEFFGVGDHAMKDGVVAPQPIQVEPGQLYGGDLASAYEGC